ncbi:MAG TPA: hypothetical protein VJL78_06685, partial [Candidatus Nitrosocosmicus sp.]|nr:hypothetical protein [Candidatus Nitrosocosmicus sp.]
MLLFFSSDLGLVTPPANQEPKFWNYVGLAQGMKYNNLLLSVNTQTAGGEGGGIDEELSSINNSNTFYTKGLLSTVLFPDYS